jgi:hypothetical protein
MPRLNVACQLHVTFRVGGVSEVCGDRACFHMTRPQLCLLRAQVMSDLRIILKARLFVVDDVDSQTWDGEGLTAHPDPPY